MNAAVEALRADAALQLTPVFADATQTPDVVTLLLGSTDPTGQRNAPASKFFAADGSKSSRQPANFVAVQLHAPDVNALRDILNNVAKLPSAAICNGRFPGQPVYLLEDLLTVSNSSPRTTMLACGFRIVPKDRLPRLTAAERVGSPILARLNETTMPTSWLALDRDNYPHTPPEFVSLAVEE
jgi:hypothetical protein